MGFTSKTAGLSTRTASYGDMPNTTAGGPRKDATVTILAPDNWGIMVNLLDRGLYPILLVCSLFLSSPAAKGSDTTRAGSSPAERRPAEEGIVQSEERAPSALIKGRWGIWEAESRRLSETDIVRMHREYGLGIFFFRRAGTDELRRYRQLGIVNIAVAHALYSPWKDNAFLKDVGALRAWVQRAIGPAEVDGLAYDCESQIDRPHALRVIQTLSDEVRRAGKVFIVCPHFHINDARFKLGPDDYNKYGDIVMPWCYNHYGQPSYKQGISELVRTWREVIPDCPVYPIIDCEKYRPAAESAAVIPFIARGTDRVSRVDGCTLFFPYASWSKIDGNEDVRRFYEALGDHYGLRAECKITGAIPVPAKSSASSRPEALGLGLENGWFVHNGRLVWGNTQHNGWWRAGRRANITRRAPGHMGPNSTEDLDKLTDNMLRYGYPGFEHCYGLWYDRRRDRHDTKRRRDAAVVPPFLEQPWARSSTGTAWDGLPKYELDKYNAWYFDRLEEFASLCDRKGTILFHNFYMQHALLETNAHYVDFPWRPANCVQRTEMPDNTPAANVFYDVTHPVRRELHRAYIRKCLDELGDHTNVIYLTSEEYTGPISFMEFWLDTVGRWEEENGREVLVALSGTKDVLDALADDLRVSVLDLRYWWYDPDGSLHAPEGGKQIPGRFVGGSSKTTPFQIYRQVREYRARYPHKGLLHTIEASRQQTWAFLMGGGSMLVRSLEYPSSEDPEHYIAPEHSAIIQPTYGFINDRLSRHLQRTVPQDLVLNHPERNWCLAETDHTYLVYALAGGEMRLDLSGASGSFRARWFDPRTGTLLDAGDGVVRGGAVVSFTAPDEQDWALWLAGQQL